MNTRTNIPRMTLRDRVANMATRDDVKGFATAMRGLIGQKRAISGGERPGTFGFVVLLVYLIVFGAISVVFIYRKKNL